MHKLNQKGLMNPLLIPLILSVLVFIAASVFSVVYYNRYVRQRDENQPMIAAAVKEATTQQKDQLQKEFAEQEKLPNKVYLTPSEYGSVRLTFPKTWSSYVVVGKTTDIDYYGHPNYVPSDNVNYALRMSLSRRQFADEVRGFDAQIKKGDLKASAITIAGTTGTRLDGALKKDQNVSMVIFPLRDKTLKVWTESQDFRRDFDNIVIKNLSFVP